MWQPGALTSTVSDSASLRNPPLRNCHLQSFAVTARNNVSIICKVCCNIPSLIICLSKACFSALALTKTTQNIKHRNLKKTLKYSQEYVKLLLFVSELQGVFHKMYYLYMYMLPIITFKVVSILKFSNNF